MILTAKSLEIQLKNGATSQEIAEAYGYNTPDYLEFSIREKLSPRAADGFLRMISKNDKAAQKLNRAKKNSSVSETIEETSIQTTEELPIESKTVTVNTSESTIDVAIQDTIDLEALKSQLANLRSNLNDKELEHRAIERKRLSIRQELEERKTSLSKILNALKAEEESVITLQNKISQTNDEMLTLNGEINSLRDKVSLTEQKIKQLEIISVYVYANGQIESSIAIPENWSEIFTELTFQEFCGNLTANQLRGLAKAKAIKSAYPGRSFEFIFETVELEEFL